MPQENETMCFDYLFDKRWEVISIHWDGGSLNKIQAFSIYYVLDFDFLHVMPELTGLESCFFRGYVTCTQPSLNCATTEGWSDALTSAGHWSGCQICRFGGTLCLCSLQETTLKVCLILLCVIVLSQRMGRSRCWLCLRGISVHPSGPESPTVEIVAELLVRSKWWRHIERPAKWPPVSEPLSKCFAYFGGGGGGGAGLGLLEVWTGADVVSCHPRASSSQIGGVWHKEVEIF